MVKESEENMGQCEPGFRSDFVGVGGKNRAFQCSMSRNVGNGQCQEMSADSRHRLSASGSVTESAGTSKSGNVTMA